MRLVLLTAAALVLAYLILRLAAQGAVFHPAAYPRGDWSWGPAAGAADVWLHTSDAVRLHGWFFAPPEATLTTLFLHGNAGNLTHRRSHIEALQAAGSEVLIVDYRGYGKSEGSPSETGLYRDAEAAYEWLLSQGRDPNRIVIHGESLGTAVAARLAAARPAAGMVLEAPFPSARAVAARVIPWIGPLLVSGFETEQLVGSISCPILVIHGDRDRVIPFDLGLQVFKTVNQPKSLWKVQGAGHNDLVVQAGPDYGERLRRFYSELSD